MVVSNNIGETEKSLAWFCSSGRAQGVDPVLRLKPMGCSESYIWRGRTRPLCQPRSLVPAAAHRDVPQGLVIRALQSRKSCRRSLCPPLRTCDPLPDGPSERASAHLEERASGPGIAGASGRSVTEIATRYELSGGMIMNVIRYASFEVISRGEVDSAAAGLTGGDSSRICEGKQVGIDEGHSMARMKTPPLSS